MKVGHPDEQRNAQDQRAVIARWFYQRLGFLTICPAYWPLRFTLLGLATRFGITDIALGSPPSILVVAAATQRTLRQSRANVQRYPALLTKMMTLYLQFEALEKQQIHLHSRLRVSRSAAAKPPAALGLLPGQTISVRHAIQAITTESANDMAALVAERLSGSERRLADRMTRKARWLGMHRTHFGNASGLPHREKGARSCNQALLRETSAWAYRSGAYSMRKIAGHFRGYSRVSRIVRQQKGMDCPSS